jgi:2-O-methyltransferase
MKALQYIKDCIPPSVKRPLRQIYNRSRGLPTAGALSHREIATLLEKVDPTILEIGCNNGSDTLGFFSVMPKARIYCFEPDPRAISRFKRNLADHFDRVTLIEAAVSNQNGQIEFHASSGGDSDKGWDQSGSIRQPKYHLREYPWVKFDKIIPVKTCRLDDWCAETGIEEVDFIWMDVQGAEGDIIKGATRTLEKTRFLYTEYSDNELYVGQPSLKVLLAMLPRFKIVAKYGRPGDGDVLLKNTNKIGFLAKLNGLARQLLSLSVR